MGQAALASEMIQTADQESIMRIIGYGKSLLEMYCYFGQESTVLHRLLVRAEPHALPHDLILLCNYVICQLKFGDFNVATHIFKKFTAKKQEL